MLGASNGKTARPPERLNVFLIKYFSVVQIRFYKSFVQWKRVFKITQVAPQHKHYLHY